MSEADNQPDELQGLWQGTTGQSQKEDHSMILRLVQERQESLLDLLRAQNATGYLISLMLAPLTAMGAWKSRPLPWMAYGYLLMTAALVAGAAIVWLDARKALATLRVDLSTREHQQRLVQFYDSRIRFSKSIKYWYAIPLFLGAGLAGYPIGVYLLGRTWGTVVVAGLLLACWVGVWRMHDVRGVADLRRRREGLQELLDAMNRE
jgi:hypothetical protein